MPRITRGAHEQALVDAHGGEVVEGLARGLRVVAAFAGERRGLTLSEVAERVGLPRASVRRLLATLAGLGFVAVEGRSFRLTPRVLTLARAYLTADMVPAVMQPVVERVAAAVRESCSAAVLDGDEIVFVARATPTRLLTVGLEVGYRLPAWSTAVGRVLLAGLPPEETKARLARLRPVAHTDRTPTEPAVIARAVRAARGDGFAIVDGEVERGFRSLAVPVRRADGRVACALHLGTHTLDTTVADTVDAYLPILQAAAAEAQAMLV
jgi:IclR family transcriptional regulator, pca regulon regulatory protein